MGETAAYGGGPVDLPTGEVAEAVRAAVTQRSPEESLQTVIEMAVECGPCDAASITMLGPGGVPETIAYSHDRVLKSDQLQYQLREGPCLDAVWTNGMFVIPDVPADGRWPRWAPQAAGFGIGASLAVHLFTDAALGAINLHSRDPREFDDVDVENARVIAAHASVVVARVRSEQDLWKAIDSRNLIGQAQGILMERYNLTAPKAFSLLRRYSQDQNTKISVLAEQLASTGELPGLDRDSARDLPDRPVAPGG